MAERTGTQDKRWARLLLELEHGFYRGTCLLLDTEWLSRNDVTLTECGQLSDHVGAALTVARMTRMR